MQIQFTELADSDIESIEFHSVSLWGPGRTAAYMAKIKQSVRRVSEDPLLWPEISIGGVRARSTLVGRHRICYRVEARGVTILRVLHAKQDAVASLGQIGSDPKETDQ